MYFMILFSFVDILVAQESEYLGLKFFLSQARIPVIAGGKPAHEGQFPWMVALYSADNYTCSASLISDRLVLTAAHCVELWNPLDIKGYAGSVNRSNASLIINFEIAVVHPDWKDSEKTGLTPDLGLLVAKEPIPFSEFIQPICLTSKAWPKRQTHHPTAQAMGWGLTSKTGISPNLLQYTTLRGTHIAKCNTNWNRPYVCMKGIKGGVCKGDSGGPLVDFDKNDLPYQVGIASYMVGEKCGEHAGYIRVNDMKDFIIDIAHKYNTKLCFPE